MFSKYPYIRLFLFCLLILFGGDLIGQEYERGLYQQNVDVQSLLYRGRVERRYTYKHKGSYFAYHEKYILGEVYFNKRLYSNIYINLNSHRDRVSVKQTENHLPVILDKRYVEWFKMGGRLFINLGRGEYKGLDAGYYEVLYQDSDKRLLKKIYKEYKELLERDVVEREFLNKTTYYVVIGDKVEKISGRKGIFALFPRSKRVLKSTYRGLPQVVRNDKDRLFKALMEVAK